MMEFRPSNIPFEKSKNMVTKIVSKISIINKNWGPVIGKYFFNTKANAPQPPELYF
jgi:hypothetical protein